MVVSNCYPFFAQIENLFKTLCYCNNHLVHSVLRFANSFVACTYDAALQCRDLKPLNGTNYYQNYLSTFVEMKKTYS